MIKKLKTAHNILARIFGNGCLILAGCITGFFTYLIIADKIESRKRY
jgi:hypothetical protein